MPRVVSLFLPSWPTDRLRRKLGVTAPPADTPLVLIGREGGRRVVGNGEIDGHNTNSYLFAFTSSLPALFSRAPALAAAASYCPYVPSFWTIQYVVSEPAINQHIAF